MHRPIVCAAVVLAAGALAQPALSAPQTSQAAAASFLAAINRHDADAACSQMLPRAQRAVGVFVLPYPGGPFPCPLVLKTLYHGVHDNGDVFTRFTALHHEKPWQEGSFVGEQFSTRVMSGKTVDSDESWVTIWLQRSGGGWLVAKADAVIDTVAAGYAPNDAFANDPPADPIAVTAPAKLPSPAFRCATRRTVEDLAGDDESYSVPLEGTATETHASWLDLRAAHLGRVGTTDCVGVELGSPLRPGTAISVGYTVTRKGSEDSNPELAGVSVDGQGEPWAYAGSGTLKAGSGFGADGNTVWLRLPQLPKGATLLVCVKSTLSLEPFLDVTVGGSDTFESRFGC